MRIRGTVGTLATGTFLRAETAATSLRVVQQLIPSLCSHCSSNFNTQAHANHDSVPVIS